MAYFPLAFGFIGDMLDEADPRPASEQIDEGYRRGEGWHPQPEFTLDQNTLALAYPGDPVMHPISQASFRDEHLFMYPYKYLLILQSDGSFEVARVD